MNAYCYSQLRRWLSDKSLEELIALYNKEVNRLGWVSIREYYVCALNDELASRGVDLSGITEHNQGRISRGIRLKAVPL
jgi:hypothetical protein